MNSLYADLLLEQIENARDIWNNYFTQVWGALTRSAEGFKGGVFWELISQINGALNAIGLALLTLFFLIGVMKSFGSLVELKRPEVAVKVLLRFVLAKVVVTYSIDLLVKLMAVCQGIISSLSPFLASPEAMQIVIPPELVEAINNSNILTLLPQIVISIIGMIIISVCSITIVLTVYGRFFKIYMYISISPVALSSFAGQPTEQVGKQFLKSFVAVCLEGVIIALACIIYSYFPPSLTYDEALSVGKMVWKFFFNHIFNMLVLVATVKAADRIIKEMMGL